MVTYGECLTWPGAIYVQRFSLKSAESVTFSLIPVRFRRCTDSGLKEKGL